MKPEKLPRMKGSEVDELLKEQFLCRIAFRTKDSPYIAPFQYTLLNGKLYFHFTNYGKKMNLLDEENHVSVEIEKYTPNLSEYKFVVLLGKLQIVTEQQERKLAIEKMRETAKEKLSENFLVAHGFSKDKGWDSLNPDLPMVIVKLENVTEKIGLKSP